MTRIYSKKDIADWAAFSGDHNSVHFDREIALKNGLSDIIVQGMLTLQHSKELLSLQSRDFNRIKYFLKKPVYKETLLKYGVKKKESHIALDIRDENEVAVITGRSFTNTDVPSKCKLKIDIDKDFIKEQYAQFTRTYPHINVPWVKLDAFLFSVCFKFQKGDPFYIKSLKIEKEKDKSKVTTLQIDQEISMFRNIDEDLINDFDNMTFFYEDTDLVKQDYSVLSQLAYQVFHGNDLVYQSSMGSLTRALEASRLNSENADDR